MSKVKEGINDLRTINPRLAQEWHPTKNGNILPSMISANSDLKVWWLGKCGHEWFSRTADRNAGSNCPYCSGNKVLEGFNDLATINPELAKEWHPTKNGELYPNNVTSRNARKVWWLGKCGHEWSATIASRNAGSNCPYCYGNKVLEGFNDLATTNPNHAQEWMYDKNDNLKPTDVRAHSEKRVWWKCKDCGHEWKIEISNRTQGSGCPKCAKSAQSSKAEKTVYYYVKKIFPDAIDSYKTEWLGNSEIDIYIPSIRLGIEYDGGIWHLDAKRDIEKTILIKKNGINVLRIREKGCPELRNIDVIKLSSNQIFSSSRTINEMMNKVFEYLRINYMISEFPVIDYDNDKFEIISLIKKKKNDNSLEKNYPELAKEWHPTKNKDITAAYITKRNNLKVWWICKKGHEYQMNISDRVNNHNCPYCSHRRLLKGFNDLATINPELAKEWHPTKNDALNPSDIMPKTEKKVWWLGKCGHEWTARVSHRSNGVGCPYCSGNKVLEGFNDLATINPELAKEWHPTKNKNLFDGHGNDISCPNKVKTKSSLKVWWLGKCGHEWTATIASRTAGSNCPYCSKKKNCI